MTIDLLAARFEIEQLIYRYGHVLDAGGGEPFADLFVEDGEIQLRSLYADRTDVDAGIPWKEQGLSAGAELQGDRLVFRGRQKLHHFSLPKGNPAIQFHVVSQPLVTILTPTTAAAQSYMRVYATPHGQPPQLKVVGKYSDQFIRNNDQWKFKITTCEI